jgi:methanogenic corrinoid protein MtbC1/DNA-binding XRE family transcriptional regulator
MNGGLETRKLNLGQLKSDSVTAREVLAEKQAHFGAAILSGDALGATQIVDELVLTRQTLSDIYLRVIAPSLVGVGDSWCRGTATTGEEKLATQIVLDQMERLRALFITPGPRSPYRVMVACVEGEHHFIGARMTADLCASRGWNVDFLGHNVPDPSLIEMVQRRRPQVLALSVTMVCGLEHLRVLANLLAETAPDVRTVVGGAAVESQSAVAIRLDGRWEITNDILSGVGLIGTLLRADRPKSVLKEYQLVLARRVRNLRTQKGWTQERLAEVTQVTRACINAVEGGKQNVSMDILVRMANALEVAPEKLLSAEG